jgi:hypothetical protein
LRLAAQRKINNFRQQSADSQNISFLPAIVSTSTRMPGEFLRLLCLQAHREIEAHFTATGMPAQQNITACFGLVPASTGVILPEFEEPKSPIRRVAAAKASGKNKVLVHT